MFVEAGVSPANDRCGPDRQRRHARLNVPFAMISGTPAGDD
jgi:hypothetical protein